MNARMSDAVEAHAMAPVKHLGWALGLVCIAQMMVCPRRHYRAASVSAGRRCDTYPAASQPCRSLIGRPGLVLQRRFR